MRRTISSKRSRLGFLCPGLLLCLSSCAASSDWKAPFRATTSLSEATTDAAAVLTKGTTQATKDLTRPIKELVSRMAPGADATGADRLEVVVFAVVNQERLREDIARGGGEHLHAFAHLLGLPADRHADFFETAQRRYQWLYADSMPPLQSLDRLLADYYDPRWQDVLN